MPRTLESVWTALLPSIMIILASVLTSMLPSVASAITTSSEDPVPFLRTICDSNCGDFGFLDERRMDAGFTDDFSLGLSLIRNGLDLTLKSDGNILIYGSVSASGTIDARSDGTFETRGNVVIDANEVRFQTGSLPKDQGSITVFDPTRLDSIFIDCECLILPADIENLRLTTAGSLITNDRRIELTSSASAITAAVMGVGELFPNPEPTAGLVIYRQGDIYIDVSGFEFENFTVIAGESIVFLGSDSTPVPEPGTALLLGLGLTMLATRRR